MDSRLCPKCGSLIEPTDKFCPWCRYDLMASRKEAEKLNKGGEQPFPTWGNGAQGTDLTGSGEGQPAQDFGDFGQAESVFPSFTSPPPQQQPYQPQTSFEQQPSYQTQTEPPVQDPGVKQEAAQDDDVYQASRMLDQDAWNNWMYTNIQWMSQITKPSEGRKSSFSLSGLLPKSKKK